ncbi:MAG: hypothetical protein IMW93_09860 [Thermoanaerobacteraceae bacterium]|nr:hypothetical protein [Thermoanaerobacteraceae bacterium]
MTIAEIFMGWPAIISSLFFAAAGIIRRRPAYLVLAAAVVVHRRKIWLAIILVSPTFIFFGWLAAIVLYQ